MYCTYILENHQKNLLRIGSTADLKQLLKERRNPDLVECSHLVYYEFCDSEAAAKEKEAVLRAMTRKERADFIKAFNPEERDLSAEL
ncbi:MAG: hypothetical protein IJX82_03130 [Clostridia bacterium]|nr:hypothetical protein [Clostridia bacterium]